MLAFDSCLFDRLAGRWPTRWGRFCHYPGDAGREQDSGL